MSVTPIDRFYFVCACGCGSVSDNLAKSYIRLTRGLRWYAKTCVPKDTVSPGNPIAGGFVIKEDDF